MFCFYLGVQQPQLLENLGKRVSWVSHGTLESPYPQVGAGGQDETNGRLSAPWLGTRWGWWPRSSSCLHPVGAGPPGFTLSLGLRHRRLHSREIRPGVLLGGPPPLRHPVPVAISEQASLSAVAHPAPSPLPCSRALGGHRGSRTPREPTTYIPSPDHIGQLAPCPPGSWSCVMRPHPRPDH